MVRSYPPFSLPSRLPYYLLETTPTHLLPFSPLSSLLNPLEASAFLKSEDCCAAVKCTITFLCSTQPPTYFRLIADRVLNQTSSSYVIRLTQTSTQVEFGKGFVWGEWERGEWCMNVMMECPRENKKGVCEK